MDGWDFFFALIVVYLVLMTFDQIVYGSPVSGPD